jgi:pfkB family carbohydrate kinase
MIVVVGAPSIRPDPETGRGEPAGLAARIAMAAAAAGANVQLAGTVGDDPAGDEVLLALARAGVRHDAVLRDAERATPLAAAVEPGPPDASSAVADLAAVEHRPAGSATATMPARPVLDAADVALCLSYLREFTVIVAAEALDPAGLAALSAAAAFAGASLVVIAPAGGSVVDVPPEVTLLESPDDDADDEFARLVARFAISMERGSSAEGAFRQALAGSGWEAAPGR